MNTRPETRATKAENDTDDPVPDTFHNLQDPRDDKRGATIKRRCVGLFVIVVATAIFNKIIADLLQAYLSVGLDSSQAFGDDIIIGNNNNNNSHSVSTGRLDADGSAFDSISSASSNTTTPSTQAKHVADEIGNNDHVYNGRLDADSSALTPSTKANRNADEISNQYGNLWIDVISYQEGFTKWRRSFACLMAISRKWNASFAEPSIVNAALRRCTNGTLPLSEVMNKTLMLDYLPNIASCQDFEVLLQDNQYEKVVLDLSWKIAWKKKEIANHPSKDSRKIAKALQMARDNPDKIFVIRIKDLYWGHLTGVKSLNSKKAVISNKDRDFVLVNHLKFKQSLYDSLDNQLSARGLTPGTFSAIHWRGEVHGKLPFHDCAKHVVDVKDSISTAYDIQEKNHTFFLMAAMSLNPNLTWSPNKRFIGKQIGEANDSLVYLKNNGFVKLEEILEPMSDYMFYVAMDLILAKRALSFSTCVRGCNKRVHPACNKCNWPGSFGYMALGTRGMEAPKSLQCWPQIPQEVHSISNYTDWKREFSLRKQPPPAV